MVTLGLPAQQVRVEQVPGATGAHKGAAVGAGIDHALGRQGAQCLSYDGAAYPELRAEQFGVDRVPRLEFGGEDAAGQRSSREAM